MGKLEYNELKLIGENLRNGGNILYPSDTLWALGCDAENDTAIDKIAMIKGLDGPEPMVILVSNLRMLLHYVPQLPPKAGDMIEYYEKPLTIVYKDCFHISDKLRAPDGSVAIRLVKEPNCAAIINSFGAAVVATMASKNAAKLPYSFQDVPTDIKKAVDRVVGFNMDFKGKNPSVMLSINSKNELVFLRH